MIGAAGSAPINPSASSTGSAGIAAWPGRSLFHHLRAIARFDDDDYAILEKSGRAWPVVRPVCARHACIHRIVRSAAWICMFAACSLSLLRLKREFALIFAESSTQRWKKHHAAAVALATELLPNRNVGAVPGDSPRQSCGGGQTVVLRSDAAAAPARSCDGFSDPSICATTQLKSRT